MNHVEEVLSKTDCLDNICTHVGSGGNLRTLAEMWKVSLAQITEWLNADGDRMKRWAKALDDRAFWEKESILGELRAVAFARVADIVDDKGELLPISQWPETAKAAASTIELSQDTVSEGDHGSQLDRTTTVKKVKLIDKLKALEMLGTAEGRLFKKQMELSGKLDLDGLVMESMKVAETDAAETEEPK